MRIKDYIWPVIGLGAVAVSGWLLYHEWREISLDDVWSGLTAIPPHGWILAALSSIVAYAALAGYDHIALLHIGKRVNWLFVTVCSFTTYALSHNIGGSVFSGAVIRYRAYGTKGLTGQDVGVLVAVCWFTFVLSSVFVGGVVILLEPGLLDRYTEGNHQGWWIGLGIAMLLFVAAYIFGSWLHLKPLAIGKFRLHYPALPIVARQLTVGPLEILAAAAIIYFALPAEHNPGYVIVLGIFLFSFAVAQASHAPGGLGVLEVVFLTGLSEMDPAAVLAALLVFRLFYLIIPLILGIGAVLGFEHSQFGRRQREGDV
ncbi:lysylphosphatidylglycerol synthase transmembrane domain-containing protein [Aminobacter sp. HY435]|uniref:lysylphosphatidylglycerol synthase transmembrane domain-containing protein n=1 Tax=Aminobacter sp. HY435 TaxID=2970917 RepID=UPI0022B98696|nr:YbhN family protein [Aminobacter sp. HY435]